MKCNGDIFLYTGVGKMRGRWPYKRRQQKEVKVVKFMPKSWKNRDIDSIPRICAIFLIDHLFPSRTYSKIIKRTSLCGLDCCCMRWALKLVCLRVGLDERERKKSNFLSWCPKWVGSSIHETITIILDISPGILVRKIILSSYQMMATRA